MSELRTHEDVERDVLKRVRHQVKLARKEPVRRPPDKVLNSQHLFRVWSIAQDWNEREILKRLKEMEEGK